MHLGGRHGRLGDERNGRLDRGGVQGDHQRPGRGGRHGRLPPRGARFGLRLDLPLGEGLRPRAGLGRRAGRLGTLAGRGGGLRPSAPACRRLWRRARSRPDGVRGDPGDRLGQDLSGAFLVHRAAERQGVDPARVQPLQDFLGRQTERCRQIIYPNHSHADILRLSRDRARKAVQCDTPELSTGVSHTSAAAHRTNWRSIATSNLGTWTRSARGSALRRSACSRQVGDGHR